MNPQQAFDVASRVLIRRLGSSKEQAKMFLKGLPDEMVADVAKFADAPTEGSQDLQRRWKGQLDKIADFRNDEAAEKKTPGESAPDAEPATKKAAKPTTTAKKKAAKKGGESK